jgi:hypothetical protein
MVRDVGRDEYERLSYEREQARIRCGEAYNELINLGFNETQIENFSNESYSNHVSAAIINYLQAYKEYIART